MENNVGKIFTLGNDNYECVYQTIYDDKTLIMLHPMDAPKGMMFVIMHYTVAEDLIQITNEIVCERIIKMYEQKENINTTELAFNYIDNS